MSITTSPAPSQVSQRPADGHVEREPAGPHAQGARLAGGGEALRIASKAFDTVAGFERGLRTAGVWSTTTTLARTRFAPLDAVALHPALRGAGSPGSRFPTRTSRTNVDLPAPDTPVTTTSLSSGSSTSIPFCRLCALCADDRAAPARRGDAAGRVALRPFELAPEHLAGQRLGVRLLHLRRPVPSMIRPGHPAGPLPDRDRSRDRPPATISGACSTTTTVLPWSRMREHHLQQALSMSLCMQTDRRLVQHVERMR